MSAPDPNRRCWACAALRAGAASCGGGIWVYWWVSLSRLSPQWAFSFWLTALLLFALAFFSPWRITRPTRVTTWAAIIIAVLMLPRSLSLSTVPYNITLDEVIHPLYGLEMLRHHPWDIAAGTCWYFNTPFLTQALQAWPCLLVEPLFGARLATLILAFASLLSTYALARRLFGAAAGLGALVVLGCSYWHIVYSRMGYPYMQPILLLPLVLHVLLRGVCERHRFLQFLGGVLLGVSLLVYTPARIAVPVFSGWLVHLLVSRSLRPREVLAATFVVALGAALTLSPYVHRQGPEGIWARYVWTSMGPAGPLHQLTAQGWARATVSLLADQFRIAARAYYAPGALMAVSDFSPAPLLDPVSLTLCLIGAGIALLRMRDGSCFLLVLWTAATFLLAQVFTDLPASAYRAAPVLPALAICAGLAVSQAATVLKSRWPAIGRPLPHTAAVLALVALILPSNLIAADRYLRERPPNPRVGMARLIGAGSRTAVYYIVASAPIAGHELFRFVADGRTIRDVSDLMDVLGANVDATRDAIFVLDPSMAAAVAAIRRCYPAAIPLSGPYPPGPHPVVAWFVSQTAVAAGRDCAVAPEGPGLRARYFAGENWDGELRRERIEDWPVHWMTSEEATCFGSIEWSGLLRFPVSGEYRFQFLTGGVPGSASVGDRLHIDPQENGSARFDRGRYAVRLRCQTRPGALCWLRWAPPGGDFDAIPPELFSPGDTKDEKMTPISTRQDADPFLLGRD